MDDLSANNYKFKLGTAEVSMEFKVGVRKGMCV